MDPIQCLMDEHRQIERVLDGLWGFAEAARAATTDPATERQDLEGFAAFLRGYADAFHHGKEEDILFELMMSSGFPREQGPIAVMLQEHAEGRAYVAEMIDLAGAEETWGDPDRRQVAAAAKGFVNLLRAHIAKEDQVLYPMARQALTPPVLEELREAFVAHEREHGAHGRELGRMGDELASRWIEASTDD